jgi:glutaredoxin-related protein
MAVTKRNTNKEEETKPSEIPTEKTVEAPACKSCNGCNGIKFLLTVAITALIVVCSFVFYLKQYQPELYSKKFEILLNNSNREVVPEQTSSTEFNPDHHKSITDMQNKLENEINLDEYDDVLNLEEKAYLKDALKEEKIYEKLKNRPDLLKVKEYMEEPIGQFVKRFSLEQQVVLFIDSNDERSKITRLAISQAKVPFGIMEVDAEPRKVAIRDALFRMTAQRTFPFIFVNGKFFGNSFALQKAMQNGSFYELVDSEENKANWLADKEDYAQKIEKRKKDNEERRRKKLEKIKKKIEEKNKNSQEL